MHHVARWYPKGPGTQYLKPLARKAMKRMALGTRNLKYTQRQSSEVKCCVNLLLRNLHEALQLQKPFSQDLIYIYISLYVRICISSHVLICVAAQGTDAPKSEVWRPKGNMSSDHGPLMWAPVLFFLVPCLGKIGSMGLYAVYVA